MAPVSKTVRFEVFKRDGFVCQYCGAKPPSVVLEVDHIHPASAGGTIDVDNLVTACFDCNRGKGARLLSSVPPSVAERAAALSEREAQLVAYNELLAGKRQREGASFGVTRDGR